MRRGPWRVLALALVLVLLGAGAALARKSGSSFSGGRSSRGWGSFSSPSKSSGWGKSSPSRGSGWSNSSRSSGWGSSPAAPKGSGWSNSAPAPRPAPSTKGWGSSSKPASGGWGNATGARAPSAGEPARRSSSFATSGQSAIQKESSRKAYNAYTGRFAKPDNPVGSATAGPAPTRTWDNYRDYSRNRDNYYSGRGWRAPGYAYRSFPSFGIWDAMFLWFMLRQASGPAFMYNHQNDPGVKAFRAEADKLAADNADLKKQLADLDTKMDEMRKDGVKPDPNAMPKGVDPSVALAAENVVREKPGSGSGFGTWLGIIAAGFGVAALFLLFSARRRST